MNEIKGKYGKNVHKLLEMMVVYNDEMRENLDELKAELNNINNSQDEEYEGTAKSQNAIVNPGIF